MQIATATAITTSLRHAQATVAAYLSLMKPHVTVLLLGTTLAAMAVATGGPPALGVTAATLIGGALAAGSANVINCFWDRDIDAMMNRTRSRSLPAGRVPERRALLFGIIIGTLSLAVFAVFVNLLATLLTLCAILIYVVIYTMWLKRTSAQNIVIGGAAGAVPVLIGWAAVTGTIAWPAIWMFVIIFLWTPPHFWSLSLVLAKDYARAGVPMLPVVKGEAATYRQIAGYSVVLVASSLMLFVTGILGLAYLVGALLLGAALLGLVAQLLATHRLANARRLFWGSNYYLALLFALMVVDRVLR